MSAKTTILPIELAKRQQAIITEIMKASDPELMRETLREMYDSYTLANDSTQEQKENVYYVWKTLDTALKQMVKLEAATA